MNNVNPNALNNLADALSPDIARLDERELLAEVAEDLGDPRALVHVFDRAQSRATRQVQARKVASLFDRFLSWCRSVTFLFVPTRPALAGLSAAVVAIV